MLYPVRQQYTSKLPALELLMFVTLTRNVQPFAIFRDIVDTLQNV
jgi:hypothetical protein